MYAKKPDNCTCNYPKVVLRNMSGHAEDCPVHIEFMAEINKARKIMDEDVNIRVGKNIIEVSIPLADTGKIISVKYSRERWEKVIKPLLDDFYDTVSNDTLE